MNQPSDDHAGSGGALQRIEDQLTDINARIARLALALGVSLDNEHDIQAALTTLKPVDIGTERRVMPDRRGGTRGGSDRRKGASRLEAARPAGLALWRRGAVRGAGRRRVDPAGHAGGRGASGAAWFPAGIRRECIWTARPRRAPGDAVARQAVPLTGTQAAQAAGFEFAAR
jgi:hypothetical protein